TVTVFMASTPPEICGRNPTAGQPGSGVYFGTWDRPGSPGRRCQAALPAVGTTAGAVVPDRLQAMLPGIDQRAGISLRLCGMFDNTLGRRNTALLTRSQLDLCFQAAPLLPAPRPFASDQHGKSTPRWAGHPARRGTGSGVYIKTWATEGS